MALYHYQPPPDARCQGLRGRVRPRRVRAVLSLPRRWLDAEVARVAPRRLCRPPRPSTARPSASGTSRPQGPLLLGVRDLSSPRTPTLARCTSPITRTWTAKAATPDRGSLRRQAIRRPDHQQVYPGEDELTQSPRTPREGLLPKPTPSCLLDSAPGSSRRSSRRASCRPRGLGRPVQRTGREGEQEDRQVVRRRRLLRGSTTSGLGSSSARTDTC